MWAELANSLSHMSVPLAPRARLSIALRRVSTVSLSEFCCVLCQHPL